MGRVVCAGGVMWKRWVRRGKGSGVQGWSRQQGARECVDEISMSDELLKARIDD